MPNDPVQRMLFAENFRLALQSSQKVITAAELSRATGLSKGLLTRYASGERVPTLWNAVAIAKALGVPLTDLVAPRQPYRARLKRRAPQT